MFTVLTSQLKTRLNFKELKFSRTNRFACKVNSIERLTEFLYVTLSYKKYLCCTRFLLNVYDLTALVSNVVTDNLTKYSISHLQETIFSH